MSASDEHDWTTARRAIPPRPRLRDFAFGGAACGLLLASMEIGLLWLAGNAMPPRLALLAIFAEASVGLALATLLGVGLRALRRRPACSALAGALVAPLLAIPALAGLATGLWPPATLLALALAVLAGALAARTGSRLERSGVTVSAFFLIAPAAAVLALAEAGRAGLDRMPGGAAAPWFLGVSAALALAYGLSLVGPRDRSAPMGWGRLFATSIGLAALAGSIPIVMTFVMLDPASLPLPPEAPASGVLLDLGTTPPGAPRNAGLDATRLAALESNGVVYDLVVPSEPWETAGTGPAGVATQLLAPGGEPVLARLAARGYATLAVAREPTRALALGAAEVDAAPGPAGRLRDAAARVAGAALLLSLPAPLAQTLRIDARLRSDAELAEDAARWLERWRATRSRVPFFVVVDFADAPSPPADGALGRLLDPLRELDAGANALLLAGARDERLAPAGAFRLLAVPPAVASRAPRNLRVLGSVEASALSALLRALPEGRANAPLVLPATELAAPDLAP